MFYWIYELPILSVVGLFALVFVGLCWLGTMLCRPFVARRVQDQTRLNEVLGDFLQYFGVIYGLLLGLLPVATYQTTPTSRRLWRAKRHRWPPFIVTSAPIPNRTAPN
jgi:hypothetical protein